MINKSPSVFVQHKQEHEFTSKFATNNVSRLAKAKKKFPLICENIHSFYTVLILFRTNIKQLFRYLPFFEH